MNPQVSTSPIQLEIPDGLSDRYSTTLEVVRAGAYSNRKPLKTLAADMDDPLFRVDNDAGDSFYGRIIECDWVVTKGGEDVVFDFLALGVGHHTTAVW